MEFVLIIVIPLILSTLLYYLVANTDWYQQQRNDERRAAAEIQWDIESRNISKQWRDHNADVRFWKKTLRESNSPLEQRVAQLTLQYLADQRLHLSSSFDLDLEAEPIPTIDVMQLITLNLPDPGETQPETWAMELRHPYRTTSQEATHA